jgi:predicted molibdopterin-dependent oxidoreductase YjgC
VVSSRRGKQFNTMIYAEIDPLTGAARDAILIHPDDAAALHVSGGDRVELVSPHGRFEGRIQLAPIARGNLQVHWPESNTLMQRGVVDPLGGVPDYNAVVRIETVSAEEVPQRKAKPTLPHPNEHQSSLPTNFGGGGLSVHGAGRRGAWLLFVVAFASRSSAYDARMRSASRSPRPP